MTTYKKILKFKVENKEEIVQIEPNTQFTRITWNDIELTFKKTEDQYLQLCCLDLLFLFATRNTSKKIETNLNEWTNYTKSPKFNAEIIHENNTIFWGAKKLTLNQEEKLSLTKRKTVILTPYEALQTVAHTVKQKLVHTEVNTIEKPIEIKKEKTIELKKQRIIQVKKLPQEKEDFHTKIQQFRIKINSSEDKAVKENQTNRLISRWEKFPPEKTSKFNTEIQNYPNGTFLNLTFFEKTTKDEVVKQITHILNRGKILFPTSPYRRSKLFIKMIQSIPENLT
jgi:hypothetical protein